ncbi:HalOD1 output domain-containing protein [Natrinema hispanicum]|uniref:Halobacterial output domain-containing protein n=1 Tax=Natrinema hispanicum TaxID=392421 RepID=A0A1I0IYW2_9EURY|nr:HalOD1 output domain-containing protein [Natrinema hispanicum]RZV05277.1 hypothetical protein BDK88_4304 [Natrinema hispanicum]SDD93819.1 hypothetical protein SAMN05192552_10744 [Natrinema hispanicum]SEU01899.1 hypothetical protein SAMN04488694_12715 [Natrinema hispanicum]
MKKNPRNEDNISSKIVDCVAKREQTDPLKLPPLYDSVDPDALDDLFASGFQTGTDRSGRVEFQYNGYTVVVEFGNDPELTVKEQSELVE